MVRLRSRPVCGFEPWSRFHVELSGVTIRSTLRSPPEPSSTTRAGRRDGARPRAGRVIANSLPRRRRPNLARRADQGRARYRLHPRGRPFPATAVLLGGRTGRPPSRFALGGDARRRRAGAGRGERVRQDHRRPAEKCARGGRDARRVCRTSPFVPCSAGSWITPVARR